MRVRGEGEGEGWSLETLPPTLTCVFISITPNWEHCPSPVSPVQFHFQHLVEKDDSKFESFCDENVLFYFLFVGHLLSAVDRARVLRRSPSVQTPPVETSWRQSLDRRTDGQRLVLLEVSWGNEEGALGCSGLPEGQRGDAAEIMMVPGTLCGTLGFC